MPVMTSSLSTCDSLVISAAAIEVQKTLAIERARVARMRSTCGTHMAHGISSAPRGRCTVWECTVCGAEEHQPLELAVLLLAVHQVGDDGLHLCGKCGKGRGDDGLHLCEYMVRGVSSAQGTEGKVHGCTRCGSALCA